MGAIFQQAGGSRRSADKAEVPVVFLPGWGFDGRICELIRPPCGWLYPAVPLAPRDLLAALHDLINRMPHKRVRLVGWSLGANLALEFARREPSRVAALELIAMRRKWPAAELDQIRAELSDDPVRFLATFYRKCFLGLPEAFRDFKLRLQEEYLRQADSEVLLAGLDYLQQTECREAPGVATRIMHGRQDIIAPIAERVDLPGAALEIVEHAGHAVFLLPGCSLHQELVKEQIRQGFSRAAATYDDKAYLQQELAQRLAADLPASQGTRPVGRILEIGCGTGSFTRLLAERFPAAELLALDFSPQMVEQAKARLGNSPRLQFVCGDGEQYLRQAAHDSGQHFDLIASNATLQWFGDLRQAVAHMAELLSSGGSLHGCLFGPDSLAELGEGLAAALGGKPLLAAGRFLGKDELRRSLGNYFAACEIKEEIFQRSYASALELLRQLKKTGTTGWRTGAPLVLSRARLARLDAWFARNHGGCRVSFQVFFLRCRMR